MSVVVEPVAIPFSPVELFSMIPDSEEGVVFFSSDGSEGSRYSILTLNPVGAIRYDGQQLWQNDQVVEEELQAFMRQIIEERVVQNETPLPFLGGLIGSLDFEYGYEHLDLPKSLPSEHLVSWKLYDHVLCYDHQEAQWHEIIRDRHRAFDWKNWESRTTTPESFSLQPQWDKARYLDAFAKIHDHIRRGEIYQACLSFPFTAEVLQTPRQVFLQLLQKNPAPMAAYLEQGDRQILSLSPERFLQWDGNRIETKPIKGTRPRSSDPTEDLQLQKDLLNNEKERAELNMITDLLRNDLAQVCVPGSVKVLLHQALQACPTVWHSYSHIVGQTKPGLNGWDILHSTFPGGSISGCPKRRAVELLREVEGYRRGIYTGCLGYISDHGQMDFNIAIRTLENTPDGLQAAFGGGIVFDSVAEAEYQECYDKARMFL